MRPTVAVVCTDLQTGNRARDTLLSSGFETVEVDVLTHPSEPESRNRSLFDAIRSSLALSFLVGATLGATVLVVTILVPTWILAAAGGAAIGAFGARRLGHRRRPRLLPRRAPPHELCVLRESPDPDGFDDPTEIDLLAWVDAPDDAIPMLDDPEEDDADAETVLGRNAGADRQLRAAGQM